MPESILPSLVKAAPDQDDFRNVPFPIVMEKKLIGDVIRYKTYRLSRRHRNRRRDAQAVAFFDAMLKRRTDIFECAITTICTGLFEMAGNSLGGQ